MSVALSTRAFDPPLGAAALIDLLRGVDVRCVYFHRPPQQVGSLADALRAAGIAVAAVEAGDADPATLATAAGAAGRLRAGALVVDGGVPSGRDARERQIEGFARRLHPLLREGAPLAVLPGAAGDALLDAEGLAWLLDDLPSLGVWLDPLRVLRRQEQHGEPGLPALLDRHAARCRGLLASGRGGDDRGGRHPEDVGADWSTLAELLPRGIPWVLDLDPEADAAERMDAIRFLRHASVG